MVLPVNPTGSPLEEISKKLFEGRTYGQEQVVSVGTSRISILRNNPNRLSWTMTNESPNDVRISTDPNITASTGWILAASGGVISMLYYDDGEVTGYEVFAVAGVVGCTVRVREVIRS